VGNQGRYPVGQLATKDLAQQSGDSPPDGGPVDPDPDPPPGPHPVPNGDPETDTGSRKSWAVLALALTAQILFGSALTTWAGSQLIFWVNVPIVALAFGLGILPKDGADRADLAILSAVATTAGSLIDPVGVVDGFITAFLASARPRPLRRHRLPADACRPDDRRRSDAHAPPLTRSSPPASPGGDTVPPSLSESILAPTTGRPRRPESRQS
jgi:hypothetical protein